MYKFIFAFAGFIIFRSWGVAVLGFIVGALFDMNERNKAKSSGGGRFGNMNSDDVFNYYQQRSSGVNEIQTMLMAQCAYCVMTKDLGKLNLQDL